MFKSGMDWLNNILKNAFGWSLTISITCCGEPEADSAAYKELMRQTYESGITLGKKWRSRTISR